MAKYQVKKVTVKDEQFLAVEFSEGLWYSENGVIYEDIDKVNNGPRPYYNIKRVKITAASTRNVPEGVKVLLSNGADKARIYFDIYKKMRELEIDLGNYKRDLNDTIPRAITRTKGLLTRDEFEEVFKNELIKRGQPLESGKWEVDVDIDVIYINRTVDIEKYFRKGSFVYEEYDGTIHICSDAQKDPTYQKLLSNNRRLLNTKYPIREYLSLGDKDWLYYDGKYRIDIKKPLSEEYALELCNKFCS